MSFQPSTYGDYLDISWNPFDSIRIGSVKWFEWLDNPNNKTFRYNDDGLLAFTAKKENSDGAWYWYAHKKINNKNIKKCLGKSQDLTAERLEEIYIKILSALSEPIKLGVINNAALER